jgi:thiamine-phosphate pyrophosphorylase
MSSRPKHPEPRPTPRLYLITPPIEDAAGFTPLLSGALDIGDVAAVLLRLAQSDERTLINHVKQLASLVQERGAALILDGHADLVARSGADGAHLTGINQFTQTFETLKPDRIAGAGGLLTKHDAMLAAEQETDYVMFGEPNKNGIRPPFETVEERINWWAELFETPCVGFAASHDEVAPLVKAGADFIALGDFVWSDPQKQVSAAMPLLRLPETAT